MDDEVAVDVFAESTNLTFSKIDSKVPIFEYTIICDLAVTEEKPAKKGAKPTLKITRQQFNKVNKHMENTGKWLTNSQSFHDLL